MTVRGNSGQNYDLDSKPFSNGGEGDIYNVLNAVDKVAKIYHPGRVSRELETKLTVMVRRPPSSRVLSQVAWPLDVLYDDRRAFCGFIMPKLDITAELLELYKYPPQLYKNVTTQQKLIVAQNICAVISEVHKAGYVFGDFNPRNIGINHKTGTVAFLDTDSYHIYDHDTGVTYRCSVCLDGYVAPELLKACETYKEDAYASAPLPTFTKETDNFALAIHIFKLLMNGYTTFNGINENESVSVASPGTGNRAVKRDNYCFKPGNKPQAVAVPSIDVLPENVAELLTRAFMYGKVDPQMRPSAIEWHAALEKYERNLKTCVKDTRHQYRQGINRCPWCEASEQYAASIAPVIKQKQFSSPVVIPASPPSSVLPPPPLVAKVPSGPTSSVMPPPPAYFTPPSSVSPPPTRSSSSFTPNNNAFSLVGVYGNTTEKPETGGMLIWSIVMLFSPGSLFAIWSLVSLNKLKNTDGQDNIDRYYRNAKTGCWIATIMAAISMIGMIAAGI